MVNAEDLVFTEQARGRRIQLGEGSTVATKWLLDDHACEAFGSTRPQMDVLANTCEHSGRYGQKEEAVGHAGAALKLKQCGVELAEIFLYVVLALNVRDLLQEIVSVQALDQATLLGDEVLQLHRISAIANNPRLHRQQRCIGASVHQLVQRREELLLCQVTSCTKDDDGQRLARTQYFHGCTHLGRPRRRHCAPTVHTRARPARLAFPAVHHWATA
mmetsp:Transcript_56724/g.122108  ORF Transcript_56724/g.122108 Transcript_56724/m.122108 type:complete len:217 (+) Transcript_56724:1603-2253(+)